MVTVTRSARPSARKWAVLWLASSLIAGGLAAQTREQETEAKISALKGEIERIEATMAARREERSGLESLLESTESELGELAKELDRLRAAIKADRPKLARLEREGDALSIEVAKQQAAIATELRQLWIARRGSGLKILFSDQGPDSLARNLKYYQRLLSHRDALISDYKKVLTDVERNRAALKAVTDDLVAQRRQVAARKIDIDTLQAKRRATLAQIERAQSSDQAKIAKLQSDAAELTELLQQLRESLAELDTPVSYIPFTQARKKLRWPIEGTPANRYGELRNAGNMRWPGWLIPASEGTTVHAIHHGRVVYSDWLRGQGLLLIVDHGEGYMSLYGHNRSLQRDVGDWVNPGDVIATAGSSGGNERPGLYFEIRKDGKTVDPGKWVKP